MPTYEYECKSCGHNFEVFQSMSDEPLKDCPECNGEIRRLIFGGTGVIFKGSGFYVTDKGGKTEKKPAKTDAASNSAKGDSSQQAAAQRAAGQQATAAASKPSADTPKTPGGHAPESRASLRSQSA